MHISANSYNSSERMRKIVKFNKQRKNEDNNNLILEKSNPRASASISLLRKRLVPQYNFKIVELGCGKGSILLTIAQSLGAKEIYGVDVNEEALEEAQAKGIKVAKVDLNKDPLPFPSNFFDIVLMQEVIEHLTNPDNAIEEAYRTLKPKGYFLISTPNLAWWVNRLALLFGYQPYWTECSTRFNVGKFRRNATEPLSGHLRLYTLKALQELVSIHGFNIVSAKGLTYDNVPFVFRKLDQLLSKKPSLSQIILLLAQK